MRIGATMKVTLSDCHEPERDSDEDHGERPLFRRTRPLDRPSPHRRGSNPVAASSGPPNQDGHVAATLHRLHAVVQSSYEHAVFGIRGRPSPLSLSMQVVAKRVGGRSVQSTRGVSAERGAVENGRGRWPQAVAGAVARRHSLRRLPVAVIRRHSLRAAALPRRKRRPARRLNLVSAKTGSIICWRCA